MRRFRAYIAAVLAAILCLSAMPTAVYAAWLGDVNRDDSVNMRDCMKLYQIISNGTDVDADVHQLSDVVTDGTVNMRDCMKLYQIISNGAELTEITLDSEKPVLTPVPYEEYYGRTQLAAENEKYVQVYDYLHEQITAMNPDIKLQKYRVTLPEFERILWHYRDDHPEVFWLNRTYSYLYMTLAGVEYIYSMQQQYLFSEGEVAAYNVMLESSAETFLDGITDDMPRSEREKLIHDRIVQNASYDTTYKTEHARDLLGVLSFGTGVCESYARALQFLLHRAGIRSALVTGVANNGEYHMWNTVELDDGWYQVDATWDDPVFNVSLPDYVTYAYYNITTAQLLLDRAVETVYSNFDSTYRISYKVPSCTATAENYHLKNAVVLDEFDAVTIGNAVADSIKNNTVAVFRTSGGYTADQLRSDLSDSINFWEVIGEANDRLAVDQKLTSPGYVPKIVAQNGIFELYLRNM